MQKRKCLGNELFFRTAVGDSLSSDWFSVGHRVIVGFILLTIHVSFVPISLIACCNLNMMVVRFVCPDKLMGRPVILFPEVFISLSTTQFLERNTHKPENTDDGIQVFDFRCFDGHRSCKFSVVSCVISSLFFQEYSSAYHFLFKK
jgi:hypothetical protein